MHKSYVYALSAVLFWSTVSTAFKVALQYTTPSMLLLIATLTSLVIYGVCISVRGQWSEYVSWTKDDWKLSVLLGLINPTAYYLVLFSAYDLLPAQEASTLNYLWPIVLVLLSIIFLKEKASWKTLLAMVICFLGTFIIANHGKVTQIEFSDSFGVALALTSTVLWASFWLFNAKDKQPALIRLFANFSFGLIFLIIYMTLSNQFTPISIEGIGASVYVGFFEMGVTFILWRNAIKTAENIARVSILVYIIPFLALWIIYFVLGEPILPSTVVGLVIIIVGILLQKLDKA